MADQRYEEYWKYTAAKTDFNSDDFLEVIRACVEYFDDASLVKSYEGLQERLAVVMGITLPSVRKMINQLVKLGFLKPQMLGYNYEAKEYLSARTNRRRASILSRIVYKYSNFNNSMQKPSFGRGQIQFFIKTLEKVGCLSDKQLTALMNVDVSNCTAGYLTADNLETIYNEALCSGFVDRKYNQVEHLWNLLGRLDDLSIHNHQIYFKTDADRLFGTNEEEKKSVRDSYLQRVYKSELEEESCNHYGCNQPKCMLEGLAYPVLIASHIKPYSHCLNDEKAQFDVNNGLLLSKNTDSLFDLGYITFNDDGSIESSKSLSQDLTNYLSHFRLHRDFLTPQRIEYMKYHKSFVFEKRYTTKSVKKYVFEGANYLMAADLEPIYRK